MEIKDSNFIPLSVHQLTDIIQSCIKESLREHKKIYGIRGLASFIGCSKPTAIKIGRSNKFPRFQEGRKIFFYESDVLKAINKQNNNDQKNYIR